MLEVGNGKLACSFFFAKMLGKSLRYCLELPVKLFTAQEGLLKFNFKKSIYKKLAAAEPGPSSLSIKFIFKA